MAFQKATKCKRCDNEFSEQYPKYNGHALCRDCYNEYQRERTTKIPKEVTDGFKLGNRKDVYQQKRKELSKIKDRNEWRALISKRLDEVLNELNKHLTYDRD